MALPAAGDIILASTISDIINPGWTDWAASLTWTATTGSAPAFGNAVKEAEYFRRGGTDGGKIDVSVQCVWGTTTTFGSGGGFIMNLPVTAHASWVGRSVGTWHALNAGAAEYGGGDVFLFSATAVRFAMAATGSGTGGNDVTNNVPIATANLGNADGLTWSAAYRPA